MVQIVCERCKKKTMKYAGTLCQACYAHRYHHDEGCLSCKQLEFDYEEYMKRHPVRKRKNENR